MARFWPLLPFAALYVSFGATFGFLASGAPVILRARGTELADIGLLQLMNLPLGLTFLWAGLLDRLTVPGLAHRTGWIALMQAGGVGLLLVLATREAASLGALFGLGTAICFCVATMDVSLEALAVETVAPPERVLVSTAKFCGASVGGILGGGLLVGASARLGWPATIGSLALLNALCLLPILGYPERATRRAEALAPRPGGRLGRFRALGWHILVLGFYFAALQAVSGSNALALVDLGLSVETVALVSGTLLPVINLALSLLAGLLVRRVGTVRLVTAGACGLLVATALMGVATARGAAALGVAATLGTYVCSTALGVPVFTMLYRWAEGPRAASDYALLFGAAFFASMPVRVGGPAVAGAIGWPGFFTLGALLYAAAVLLLRRAIARSLDGRGEPGGAAP